MAAGRESINIYGMGLGFQDPVMFSEGVEWERWPGDPVSSCAPAWTGPGSTLYETRVAPSFAGPFSNADLIQRDALKASSMQASYRAAEIAAERRARLLQDPKSVDCH
jgi:hypothetical protein